MEMIVKVFITLLITIEFGITPTGRIGHKTIKVPCIREGVTDEEIRATVDVMRRSLAGPVTAVNLKTEVVKTVWSPEMRKEKLENEGEEVSTEHGQQTAATQSSISPASSVQTAQVQAPAVVVGEEAPLMPKDGSRAPVSNNHFPGLEPGPSDVGVTPALPKAESPQKTLDPGSSPGNLIEKPADTGQYMNFMDRMRANGFKVRLEDLYKSPFADTITSKGAKPEIKKLDVPFIYVDQ